MTTEPNRVTVGRFSDVLCAWAPIFGSREARIAKRWAGRQKLYGNVGYRIIEANVQELLRDKCNIASWC